MGFTTQIFVFIYLPLAVAGVALCRLLEGRLAPLRRARLSDWALAAGSLAFYGWTVFDGIYRLFLYALAVWAAGRLIGRLAEGGLALPLYREGEDRPARRVPLASLALGVSAALVLFLLFRFKYWNFAVPLWNAVTQAALPQVSLPAPLGISFLTFSAISYLADVRRGLAPAGSFLDCLLYLSFFPKVVSGPIVLWRDFQPQLGTRRTTLDGAVSGVERIAVGFAKKLILADMFGACVAEIDSAAAGAGIDAPTAWLAVLLYMLQIYYDFAGYSDIAIGLGRLFGFQFKENFHFPYRSRSVTEFWRRWHISLGSWFREYVYIPLGGSRLGLRRTLWNLAVVFALTGVWHGAGWNYILWGGINGFFVLLERVVRDRPLYKKTPDGLKWGGTMVIAMLFWQLFRFQSVREAGRWLAIGLGLVRFEWVTLTWRYFLDARLVFLLAVGVLGAAAPGGERLRRLWERFTGRTAGLAVREAGALVLFALAALCMVNSTYSPFIYFQY